MANFQLFFSVQGKDGSPTGPDPENRVGDQGNGNYRSHVADLRPVKEPWVHIPGIIWPLFPPIVPPVAARGATAGCGRERQREAPGGQSRND
jgi:hypothetical protein